MLGVCLLFVGIVLINNGVCTLLKVEPKAASRHEAFCGILRFCGGKRRNFWRDRRCNRVQGAWYYSGLALGGDLVAVGDSVGNRCIHGFAEEGSWEVCSGAADRGRRDHGMDPGRDDPAGSVVRKNRSRAC